MIRFIYQIGTLGKVDIYFDHNMCALDDKSIRQIRYEIEENKKVIQRAQYSPKLVIEIAASARRAAAAGG